MVLRLCPVQSLRPFRSRVSSVLSRPRAPLSRLVLLLFLFQDYPRLFPPAVVAGAFFFCDPVSSFCVLGFFPFLIFLSSLLSLRAVVSWGSCFQGLSALCSFGFSPSDCFLVFCFRPSFLFSFCHSVLLFPCVRFGYIGCCWVSGVDV